MNDFAGQFPSSPPPLWVHPAAYESATDYLCHYLFTSPSDFLDQWKQYSSLKSHSASDRKLAHERFPYMVGLEAKLKSYAKTQGLISLENLDKLFTAAEVQSAVMLDRRGWVAPKPNSSLQKRFREGGLDALRFTDDELVKLFYLAYGPEKRMTDRIRRRALKVRKHGLSKINPTREELMTTLILCNGGLGRQPKNQDLLYRRVNLQMARYREMKELEAALPVFYARHIDQWLGE